MDKRGRLLSVLGQSGRVCAEDVLSRSVEVGLRAAVLAFKTATPRGHVPRTIWAGLPAADPAAPTSTRFAPQPGDSLDQHLRTEVASALVHRVVEAVPAPLLWVTRSGDLDLVAGDLAWLAAGRAAWTEAGLAPSFVLLTRHGWRHHPTGRSRRWRRLRA